MADAARSARPPWALTCWVDDNFIYSEVPCANGPPLIQKYPLTEGGLSHALNFLRTFHRKHQPTGGDYKITLQANIKRAKPEGNEAQRAKAREILRKLNIA